MSWWARRAGRSRRRRERCAECGEQKLVAFSCGGRGFCPSCLGRRMAQTAANLVDHVLPEGVPLRQFVLTVPFALRARLAYDRELMDGVGRIFVDTVRGFYERKSRERGVVAGEGGAFTVVQRVSSDLRLNPHYHSVFLDGVFAPGDDGKLEFQPLGSLSNADVARASVSGLAPAGPERRTREPIALRGKPGVEVASGLNVTELGFSLHAATVVAADDRAGREALCKYVLRPPIAAERVALLEDGLVSPFGDHHEARRLVLNRPFSDGTVAVDLDPLSLLIRLCATVPPPKMHLLRYAGVLASAHKWRSRVVPAPPPLPERAAREPALRLFSMVGLRGGPNCPSYAPRTARH